MKYLLLILVIVSCSEKRKPTSDQLYTYHEAVDTLKFSTDGSFTGWDSSYRLEAKESTTTTAYDSNTFKWSITHTGSFSNDNKSSDQINEIEITDSSFIVYEINGALQCSHLVPSGHKWKDSDKHKKSKAAHEPFIGSYSTGACAEPGLIKMTEKQKKRWDSIMNMPANGYATIDSAYWKGNADLPADIYGPQFVMGDAAYKDSNLDYMYDGGGMIDGQELGIDSPPWSEYWIYDGPYSPLNWNGNGYYGNQMVMGEADYLQPFSKILQNYFDSLYPKRPKTMFPCLDPLNHRHYE